MDRKDGRAQPEKASQSKLTWHGKGAGGREEQYCKEIRERVVGFDG